jgi:ribosomal protein S18 acetylase RimI-like enzyme
MPDVTIRPARADDAPFLAWVMLAASRSHLRRGAWDLTFDGSDEVCLGHLRTMLLAEPPTFCHHQGFAVAEVDGRPAAALAGYDPGRVAEPGAAVNDALRRAGWSEAQVAASDARFAPFLTCVPDQRPGVWVVEWVATRPEHRRRGLVDALLGEMLAAGRRQGYRHAQISVLIGNTAAEHAYAKAGFMLERDRRHPAFEAAMGCPGIAQLGRAL